MEARGRETQNCNKRKRERNVSEEDIMKLKNIVYKEKEKNIERMSYTMKKNITGLGEAQ